MGLFNVLFPPRGVGRPMRSVCPCGESVRARSLPLFGGSKKMFCGEDQRSSLLGRRQRITLFQFFTADGVFAFQQIVKQGVKQESGFPLSASPTKMLVTLNKGSYCVAPISPPSNHPSAALGAKTLHPGICKNLGCSEYCEPTESQLQRLSRTAERPCARECPVNHSLAGSARRTPHGSESTLPPVSSSRHRCRLRSKSEPERRRPSP